MMSPDTIWTARDAAAATGGTARGDWRAAGVATDVARVRRGDLFVALPDAAGDGQDRALLALRAGAAAAVVMRVPPGAEDKNLLVVVDTEAALRELARTARRRSGAKIIAVAGATGRADAGRMMDAVFRGLGQAYSSSPAGEEPGAALTLAGMPAGADYGVFDAGHPVGGHEFFMTTAYPHILLTDIGGANWKDALRHVAPGGTVLVSRDDRRFDALRLMAGERNVRLCGFGAHRAAEARLDEWTAHAGGARVRATILGEEISLTLAAGSRTAALQALGALLAARLMGGDLHRAVRALTAMKPAGAKRRGRIPAGPVVALAEDHARTASVSAAFRVLALVDPGRGRQRIAVLRDMPAPGGGGARLQTEGGLPLRAADVHLVYTGGPLMKSLYDCLPEEQRGVSRRAGAELAQIVPDVLTPGDVVMVKASQENRAGVVVEALRALPETPGRKKKR